MRINEFLIGLLLLGCNPVDRQHEEVITSDNAITASVEEIGDCLNMTDLEFKNTKGSSIAFFGLNPFSGMVCSYFSSGEISTLTSFQNGVKQGVWRVYFENGQIEKEGNIEHGKEHGSYYEYFPNGQLRYDYTYNTGKKTGVWKSWYEHGSRYTERNFKNDQLHGKVLVWNESGKLAKEYDYDRGTLVNSIMHFKNKD